MDAYKDLSGGKPTNAGGIVIEGLSKVYRTTAGDAVGLDGVSCSFAPGEAIALMGPSGCGKTSLLNMLGGMDRASAGCMEIGGRDITGLSERGLEQYRLAGVGYIFQFFNLIPSLSARDNIELPLLLAGVSDASRRRARAQALLDQVGLGQKADKRPEQLSGGEQQRVAVCVALVNDPPLILGDEPTGNLDSENNRVICDLLVSLAAQGRTVIIATHDPGVAERFPRVIRMRDGRIVSDLRK